MSSISSQLSLSSRLKNSWPLVVYMTGCAVVFFVFRHELIIWFVVGSDVTAEQAQLIVSIGAKLMICAAIFQTVTAVVRIEMLPVH